MEVKKSSLEDLVMNPTFWNNKKVLLTGHTGFKGSWLSLWLQKLNVNLVGFSNDIPTNPSLFELADVKSGMRSIMGDIRNFDSLKEVVEEHKPEIVIHMAAQSLVQSAYKNPIETYATNIMGTVNLLEAVRACSNMCVVINVTSDKCYDNKETLRGYREDDPMGGYDPYSSSKACSELITSAFRNSFFNSKDYSNHGVALASVRSGNVIGGGDWAKNRLIPDIIRGIMERCPVMIRNPESIRPWQHVLDPLHGYLLLIEKMWKNGMNYAEGWNFGPIDDDAKSVSWLVKKFEELWGKKISTEYNDNEFYYEAKYLSLDCSKAKKNLDWFPKLDISTSLEWTMKWYKEFFQKKEIRKLTEEQIDQFNLL